MTQSTLSAARPSRRAALSTLLAPVAAGLLPGSGHASDFPTRPITVIVPFGPGGAVQSLTERLGPDLRTALGQPMINDYKGGGGGTIAGEATARAAPNGYTVMLGTPSALAAGPAVYRNIKYNPLTDLVPVALVATTTFVVVVNDKLPVRDIRELISYGKANPGKLNFASAGVGSMDHIGGEVLQKWADFKMTHIPYKGPGASLLDVAAGRVDLLISSPIPVKPHADAGRVRMIAVTSKQRSPSMKEIPAVAEAGFPDYDLSSWYGYVAPAGTPRDAVLRINGAVASALTNKDTIAYMAGFGLQPAPGTPEEFGNYLAQDVKRWQDWARLTGVQAE
ncbi:MAG: Bug family tripartite tricarboxylate transporter substrate binding protein [Lautropia sp.]